MSWYSRSWPAYVSVASRRRQATREVEKLRKSGKTIAPVRISGRAIATTFWGKAWCDNLESYRDYENRLPRGRSYVRNGAVVDLQIAPREVRALVSGSAMYRVSIDIGAMPDNIWKSICADCNGQIDSLVELLRGHLSKNVMARLCRQDQGLFPKPSEIRFSCSCPDYASMCKHVAAAFYGIGARLDEQPALLFRLRAVNEDELVANIADALPASRSTRRGGRALETDDIAALFGLDMVLPEYGPAIRRADKPAVPVAAAATKRSRPSRKRKAASGVSFAEKPAAKEVSCSGKGLETRTAKRCMKKAKFAQAERQLQESNRLPSGISGKPGAGRKSNASARLAETKAKSRTVDRRREQQNAAKMVRPPKLAKGGTTKRRIRPK